MEILLTVLLGFAVIAILYLLGRPSPAPLERTVTKEVRIYVPTSTPRYEGPPLWESNRSFTEYVEAIGRALESRIGLADRAEIAARADVARGTLDRATSGRNITLHTLWRLCKAQRCAVSRVCMEAEADLTRDKTDATQGTSTSLP